MKELFREIDPTKISFYQSLLESEGIQTFLRNDNLSTTAVSIPDFYPALCVVDDADFERAGNLIREHVNRPPEAVPADVTCKACGEVSPGNFEICWNCGASISLPKNGEQSYDDSITT